MTVEQTYIVLYKEANILTSLFNFIYLSPIVRRYVISKLFVKVWLFDFVILVCYVQNSCKS